MPIKKTAEDAFLKAVQQKLKEEQEAKNKELEDAYKQERARAKNKGKKVTFALEKNKVHGGKEWERGVKPETRRGKMSIGTYKAWKQTKPNVKAKQEKITLGAAKLNSEVKASVPPKKNWEVVSEKSEKTSVNNLKSELTKVNTALKSALQEYENFSSNKNSLNIEEIKNTLQDAFTQSQRMLKEITKLPREQQKEHKNILAYENNSNLIAKISDALDDINKQVSNEKYEKKWQESLATESSLRKDIVNVGKTMTNVISLCKIYLGTDNNATKAGITNDLDKADILTIIRDVMKQYDACCAKINTFSVGNDKTANTIKRQDLRGLLPKSEMNELIESQDKITKNQDQKATANENLTSSFRPK